MVIIFNLVAVAVCGVAFFVAFGLGHLLGMTEQRSLVLIGGPVAMVLDLIYRTERRRWFHPRGGASLFYVPVWLLGVFLVVPSAAVMLLAPNGKLPRPPSRSEASSFTFPWPSRITSEAEGRREALRLYPSLGVPNSPLNVEFVRRYKQCQQQNPQFFRDPAWPVTLVKECASGVGVQR